MPRNHTVHVTDSREAVEERNSAGKVVHTTGGYAIDLHIEYRHGSQTEVLEALEDVAASALRQITASRDLP